jgi:RAD50-interacting protein 1
MAVAMSRYNDILSESDASEIEYEGVDALEVKPTKGAMRVMDLLETFTGTSVAPYTTEFRSLPWISDI